MEAKTLARVTRGLLWLVAAGVVLLLGGLYFHGGSRGCSWKPMGWARREKQEYCCFSPSWRGSPYGSLGN